jgi:hypothetical protein
VYNLLVAVTGPVSVLRKAGISTVWSIFSSACCVNKASWSSVKDVSQMSSMFVFKEE